MQGSPLPPRARGQRRAPCCAPSQLQPPATLGEKRERTTARALHAHGPPVYITTARALQGFTSLRVIFALCKHRCRISAAAYAAAKENFHEAVRPSTSSDSFSRNGSARLAQNGACFALTRHLAMPSWRCLCVSPADTRSVLHRRFRHHCRACCACSAPVSSWPLRTRRPTAPLPRLCLRPLPWPRPARPPRR